MKKNCIYFFFFLIILFIFPCVVLAKTAVSFNSSWQYAGNSKIHSGQAYLYEATSNSNGHTVAINAGHGTKGGGSIETLCHPDGSPKVTGGSTAAGATKAAAVSAGMTFKDGTSEATVTLRMAEITRDLLLENGFNVLMIRDGSDVQLDNIARTVMSNNNADIHLAIHWDSSETNKGVFFMSVPNNSSYKNMEPVKSHWQEHNELGRKIISVMKSDGIKIFSDGEMEMDLTQTSYSTIPSIDIEFGDKVSPHDDTTLKTLANAFVHGISEYFNTSFTPSQGGGGNKVSSSSLDLNSYSLLSEQKSVLEEAMKSWPSEMDAGRIEVLKKALSLINIGIHYPNKKSSPDNCSTGHYDRAQPKSGDGMDCSDYVAWAFHAGGATDVSTELCTYDFAASSVFTTINESDLLPGDIALNRIKGSCDHHYTSSSSDNHVGIYFGKAYGQNIFLHSTSGSTITGPQVRTGNGNFQYFRRYNNFSSIEGSSSSSSSSSTGATGYVTLGLQEDEYEGNGFQEIETEEITCHNVFMKTDGSDELNELGEFVDGLFLFIKIATPIIVIILSTIDYMKAISSPDDSLMKKTTQKIGKRILFGTLIFLLPFILELLFQLFGFYDLSTCGIGIRAG